MKELSQSPRQIARREKRAIARNNRQAPPLSVEEVASTKPAKKAKKDSGVISFSIVSMAVWKDTPWRVHVTGCADAVKDARGQNGIDLILAPDCHQAVAKHLEGELSELGYNADYYHLCNCARKAR